jgi:hypothetical protein
LPSLRGNQSVGRPIDRFVARDNRMEGLRKKVLECSLRLRNKQEPLPLAEWKLHSKAIAMPAETNIGASTSSNSERVVADVKATVGEIAEPLKEKAEQIATEQKEAGSGHIRTLATAVHGAARELEGGMPGIARSIHDVGQRIESTADTIRNKSVEELFDSFDQYARRQPGMVFGGAVIAGLVLTRFLKSSAAAAPPKSVA